MIVDGILTGLRAGDVPARILLSSCDPMSMRRAGQVGSEFLRGQLVANPVPLDIGLALALEFGMDAVNPEFEQLRDDAVSVISDIREAGLHTVVWDVNTAADVALMVAAGVDVIITDNPGMAREVLDQR